MEPARLRCHNVAMDSKLHCSSTYNHIGSKRRLPETGEMVSDWPNQVVALTDLAVALEAAASRMSRDVLDVLEEGDPGAATSATSSLDCGSNDDVEDFRDLPVVDVATEDRAICGFGRGGNLSAAGLTALLFATLHGLLFGGEAGRSLTGVSALRGCFPDGVADLVLRLPSIEVRSMTDGCL